jgi:predicted metal-dependent hydrolase
MQALKYLSAYSDQTREQVSKLIAQDKLADVLRQRYSSAHTIRTDKALYDYVQELKSEFLRNADPINKVAYDNKIHVIQHALGLQG